MTVALRRALVTGATGFIGTHLVRHLEAAGWEVAALVRPTTQSRGSKLPESCRSYVYTGHTSEVIQALADFRPDVVFHLASLFLASHTAEQIEPLVAANILLGTQLLEAMRAADVRLLVNAGTSWQNFRGDAYHPVNLYAATKQAFESVLAYYVEACALRAVTLRLYDTYGPGDERAKLLQLLLRCLRTGEPLSLSPGQQVLDLVHVDDVCRALLRASELAQEREGAQVYAVSSSRRRTLRQVVALLEETAGRPLAARFGATPYRDREVMLPWLGPAMPGWSPQIDLLDGLQSMLAAEALLTPSAPLNAHAHWR